MPPTKLRQEDVDEVRYSVLTSLLVAHVRSGAKDKPRVRHLRFHEPRTSAYELRDWNPPSDTDRHPWERGLRLEIDVGDIPPSVASAVRALIKAQRQEGNKAPGWNVDGVRDIVARKLRREDRRIWLPGNR